MVIEKLVAVELVVQLMMEVEVTVLVVVLVGVVMVVMMIAEMEIVILNAGDTCACLSTKLKDQGLLREK